MAVAKVTEITAASPESFEHAIQHGVERAGKTLKNIQRAWAQELCVDVEGGEPKESRVNMKVTFVLDE